MTIPREFAHFLTSLPRAAARLALGASAACFALLAAAPVFAQSTPAVPASSLLDISGVSWMENDLFVAVHDGKANEEEMDRPRVSLLLLPADVTTPPQFARQAPEGLFYQNLDVAWPSGVPNDLESIARIPDTRSLLLVESGDDCSTSQRIFRTTLSTSYELTVDEVAPWPAGPGSLCAGVFNVESSAVFRIAGQLFFVYAERAEGLPHTELRWAKMQTSPLRFGPFSSFRFAARVQGPGMRPLVALDVDPSGQVYAASAYDSGEDNGPYRSYVSRIGRFRSARGGHAHFVPSGKFADVAQQDGYKIEGVAVRPEGGAAEIYAGTDDENYGATMRKVAPIP
ncbi:MAG: hypothetical protein ABR587_06505 [Candidatus Binatia bacterium]